MDDTHNSEANGQPSIPNVPQQKHQHQHHHHSSSSTIIFKQLVGACKRKELGTIESILGEHPELINQRDRYNRNLLHYTVILFRRFGGGGGGESFQQQQSIDDLEEAADTISISADQQQQQQSEQRTSENLICFNYLLDRCNQKLWWQQDLDGLTLLHLAVISSNNPLVKFIIYEHPYSVRYPLVCTPDNERHSPLHWAVITNNLECVKLLVNSSLGLKLIHEPDFNGATPLHYATQTSDYPKYRKQLRLMLRNVASDHQSADQSFTEPTAVKQGDSCESRADSQKRRMASHTLDVLELLVKTPQVNIECRDKDRRTPLLWAASSGNRDAVLLLIGAGANPQSCDINKLGALHCAASHGFTECLESLLSVSKRGSSTTGALASERSVNQPDNLNCTPIFYAVLSGNIDCVELLADRGAQLDWQDSKGRSAAHFAALKGQLNSLKLLRRRGANLWLANRQGDLPLHYALKGGRHQVAKWLLDHSPYENSVNAINNFGRAPIHLVVQRDDSEMLDYLIKRGANLNQLVKVRDNHQKRSSSVKSREQFAEPKAVKPGGGEYHYETALDMAKKLGHEASLRQLVESGAQIAAQVMSSRSVQSNRSGGANVNSLFDLQSVDGPSPIRYDTSSSSAAASPHQAREDVRVTRSEESALPKLSRPRPDSLPQSESSGGSSALSQNSLTSIRGYHGAKQTDRAQHPDVREEETSPAGDETMSKPYRGGITYNNERINASIKCKLYDQHTSYPPALQHTEPSRSHRHRSAPTSGQEIITNVNVYTSPCPLANHHFDLQPKYSSRGVGHHQQLNSPEGDETSDGPETSCDDETNILEPVRKEQPLPAADSRRPQHLLTSRLPPSQGHEQHLPVILSEREEVSTSGDDRSPEVAAGFEPSGVSGHFSPSKEEPRFDKSDRGRGRPVHTRRQQQQQTKSPVAEYIRAPLGSHCETHQNQRAGYESHHLPDFSQVKSKVDSHRLSEDRSRSLARHNNKPDHQPEARSLSRQTFTREPPAMQRHESQDSFEFELGVEKSIRKYKQEKRLFEELQGLKRSQIRSGRANEAVLVKRLVEHLRREQLAGANDLLGMDNYAGPYTYKSYERFLYDQLRKLSQSNCAKLSKSMRDFEQELMRSDGGDFSLLNDDANQDVMTAADFEAGQQRDFLEEDMQADMELRRVIEGDTTQEESKPEPAQQDNGEKLPQIVPQEEQQQQQEPEVRRGSVASVGSSSRRSSIDVEREKLETLPLQTSSVEQTSQQPADDDDNDEEETKSLIECEANSICSAIMVDALGNLAAHSTVPKESGAGERPEETSEQGSNEDVASIANDEPKSETFAQAKSRRRSVVNIGNKVEIIYHDVGIEIDHAGDATATDEETQEHSEERSPSIDVSKMEQETEPTSELVEQEQDRHEVVEEAQAATNDRKASVADGGQLEQTEKVKANLRRASSPPGEVRLLKDTALIGDRRRLSSIDSGTSVGHSAHSYIAEIKKVFNGYDLDEYLERKKNRQTPEPLRRSQESDRKLLTRQRSTKKRLRKERSILPKEKFVPRVDVQQIKDRWTRVKAVERARKEDAHQENGRGSFEQARHLARSQPSLERYESGAAAEKRKISQESASATAEADPAFSLLYEINVGKRNESRSAERWCQSRIVKIVDVRCLKRTLSLPESVLYSNELIKRFNILKL